MLIANDQQERSIIVNVISSSAETPTRIHNRAISGMRGTLWLTEPGVRIKVIRGPLLTQYDARRLYHTCHADIMIFVIPSKV